MRALIFEPTHRGHRLQHVRYITEALLELGHEPVVVVGRQAPDSAEFATHLASLPSSVRFVMTSRVRGGSTWAVAGQMLELLDQVLLEARPDHVFVPYADGMTQRGAVAFAARQFRQVASSFTEALQLRGHFAYPVSGARETLERFAARTLVRRPPWRVTHLMDPLAFEFVRQRAKGAFDLMPEPVEPRPNLSASEARGALGIDPDARYVGSIGAVDTRKGADLLVAAAGSLPSGVRLLLVGAHDTTVRNALAGRFRHLVDQGRIISIDRYVAQQDFDAAFAACDVFALPYRKHAGSSGILVRAIAAGKPVVTPHYGWMGECVRRFDAGVNIVAMSPEGIASALCRALDLAPLTLTESAERFIRFNTVAGFQDTWTRAIRRRTGEQPGPAARSWEWVMSGRTDPTDVF